MKAKELMERIGEEMRYIHITSAAESDIIDVVLDGLYMHKGANGQKVVSAVVRDRSGAVYYARPEAVTERS